MPAGVVWRLGRGGASGLRGLYVRGGSGRVIEGVGGSGEGSGFWAGEMRGRVLREV